MNRAFHSRTPPLCSHNDYLESCSCMYPARSSNLLEYPHSLSYHDTNFTKLSFNEIPAFTSKIEERASPTKSCETTSSSVHPKIPFIGPSAAALIVSTISAIFADFSIRHVKSTTETSAVGTRNAIPVNFPFTTGR